MVFLHYTLVTIYEVYDNGGNRDLRLILSPFDDEKRDAVGVEQSRKEVIGKRAFVSHRTIPTSVLQLMELIPNLLY